MGDIKRILSFLTTLIVIKYANGGYYGFKGPGFPDSDYSPIVKPSVNYYGQQDPIDVSKYKAPEPEGVYHSSSDKVTVHRHVFVYVGPNDEPIKETRVIRPDIPKQKHVNIIFVKSPDQSNNRLTEVILPEEPLQKTLVYILVKKREDPEEYINVKAPEPTEPSKPEVFFIRYKSQSNIDDHNDKPSYGVYPSKVDNHANEHHETDNHDASNYYK